MVVVDYNSDWPILFSKIENELKSIFSKYECIVLGDQNIIIPKNSFTIIHIGSTSINGMYARPIIDIVIKVYHSIKICRHIKDVLESIGYCRNEGILGMDMFYKKIKNNEYLDNIPHQIYICDATNNNNELKIIMLFKNYLIKNKDKIIKYNNIKKENYKWFFEDVANLYRMELYNIAEEIVKVIS